MSSSINAHTSFRILAFYNHCWDQPISRFPAQGKRNPLLRTKRKLRHPFFTFDCFGLRSMVWLGLQTSRRNLEPLPFSLVFWLWRVVSMIDERWYTGLGLRGRQDAAEPLNRTSTSKFNSTTENRSRCRCIPVRPSARLPASSVGRLRISVFSVSLLYANCHPIEERTHQVCLCLPLRTLG